MLISTGRKRATDYCSVYLKSCFVEEKPIIGCGTNSCFHHRLRGRKLPNKDDITGLKGGHHGDLKLDFLLEPLEFYRSAYMIFFFFLTIAIHRNMHYRLT